jgi:phage terminase large subunit-like protein
LLAAPASDERKFAIIFAMDDGDDWTSEVALRKANPLYDVSVSGEFLQAQQREAIRNARKQATFKTKHLNQWVTAGQAFFNIELWDRCKTVFDASELVGRDCLVGVDLASKNDLASVVKVFLPTADIPYLDILARHYVPDEKLKDKENEHYRGWVLEGHLIATDGAMLDHDRIYDDALRDATAYNIRELAFDPYQAVMLIARLMDHMTCVEYGQTVVNMSDPMKYAEALIRQGRVRHNGDPVLRWCLSNVEARADVKDNVYPRKAGNDPARKIDAAVALIQAIGRFIALNATREGDFDSFIRNPVTV